MVFPSHLLVIHLNLYDNGFPFCPLCGDEHQESSVQKSHYERQAGKSNLDYCHLQFLFYPWHVLQLLEILSNYPFP